MKRVTPPKQSNFRVYAILTWKDTATGITGWVSGTNSESSFIGGSLCAERAAAVQLRELPTTCKVTAIYLTSDLLDEPITPGVLCREFLLSCVSPEVPIWMCTADCSTVRSSTLRILYPFPNIYENVPRNCLKEFGEKCCNITLEASGHWPSESAETIEAWTRLIDMASKASRNDVLGRKMHPCSFSAAVEFDDGTFATSWQKAGLEYGTTVDAVTSLLRDIENTSGGQKGGPRPIRLVQVDQFSNLVAPFAPARAQLFERGHELLKVAVMNPISGRRRSVTVKSLVPDCPTMGEIWS